MAAKNAEIVAEGITDKSQTETYCATILCMNFVKMHPLIPMITRTVHIYMTKHALQLSSLDQQNEHLKIQQQTQRALTSSVYTPRRKAVN